MSRFDPDEHPRWPRGTGEKSGEFRDKAAQSWVAAVAARYGRGYMSPVELAEMVPRLQPVAPLRGGAMGKTQLMHDPDTEMHVVHKEAMRGYGPIFNAHGTSAEVAASLVGQTVGVPAPTVIRDPDRPQRAVYMQYAVGDLAEHRGDISSGFFPHPDVADSDDGVRLGLMDALIGNTDRHPGNWVWSGRGRIIPIDHGESFELNSRYDNNGEILPPNGRHAGFTPPFVDWSGPAGGRGAPAVPSRGPGWQASNPLHRDDVKVLRKRLKELRPAFLEMGFGQEHDQMMQRFEAIAKRAHGIRRLLS